MQEFPSATIYAKIASINAQRISLLTCLCPAYLGATPSIFRGMGKSAKWTVAFFHSLFRMLDRIFPIVKYIGQGFLSREKFVKKVTSDAHMIGPSVAPSGN